MTTAYPSDDDEGWLAALAGHRVHGHPDAPLAHRLRWLLLAPPPADESASTQALADRTSHSLSAHAAAVADPRQLARHAQARVLTPSPARQSTTPRRQRTMAAGTLAIALVGAALWWAPSPAPMDDNKSSRNSPAVESDEVRVSSDDPSRDAARLLAWLAALGVPAQLQGDRGDVVLEAAVPPERLAGLHAALADTGYVLPAGPHWRMRFAYH